MSRPLVPYKILVVDDERTVSDTLSLIFRGRGYDSQVAYSAETAISILGVWQPDVALLDVVLPKMNGIDLAILLKAMYPACKILLFSGHLWTGELVEQALLKGHRFEILSKPVHPDYMLQAISRLLEELPQT